MVDFTVQWDSIFQKLDADWNSLLSDIWQDSVHDKFEQRFIQHMKDCIVAYLQGSCGSIWVREVGLVDIEKYVEESAQELSGMTGEPFLLGDNNSDSGNDYIHLRDNLLRNDGTVKSEYRDRREEYIHTNESEDITYKRQHPLSMKAIMDL